MQSVCWRILRSSRGPPRVAHTKLDSVLHTFCEDLTRTLEHCWYSPAIVAIGGTFSDMGTGRAVTNTSSDKMGKFYRGIGREKKERERKREKSKVFARGDKWGMVFLISGGRKFVDFSQTVFGELFSTGNNPKKKKKKEPKNFPSSLIKIKSTWWQSAHNCYERPPGRSLITTINNYLFRHIWCDYIIDNNNSNSSVKFVRN